MPDAELEVIESDTWESRRRSFDPPETASSFARMTAPHSPSLPGMASEMVPSPEERLGWSRAIMVFDARERPHHWFEDCATRGLRALGSAIEVNPTVHCGVPTLRGTHCTVSQVLRALADSNGVYEVSVKYDLPAEAITGILDGLSLCFQQPLALPLGEPDIKQKFARLAECWTTETGAHSSINARKEHPAYSGIVSLGWEVVPLLLKALKETPDFWFPALRDITNENPVAPDHRGNYDLMAEDWLKWGEERGIIR